MPRSRYVNYIIVVSTVEGLPISRPEFPRTSLFRHGHAFASTVMGHWGTCPLEFQQFNIFSVNFRAAQSLTATLCGCRPLQTYLYFATAAAIVQSRLHEPCSLYYFALFYVRQKVSCSFVPLSHQILETPPRACMSRVPAWVLPGCKTSRIFVYKDVMAHISIHTEFQSIN